MMSEIQGSFPEKVEQIYRSNIKKSDKELNTQYLKQNTSFTHSLKLVGMWEYFISDPAKDSEILLSWGARTCLIIAVRDPQTKVSGMIHIPILEDEVKMNDGTEADFSKFYDFAINQFRNKFLEKNNERIKIHDSNPANIENKIIESHNLDIYLYVSENPESLNNLLPRIKNIFSSNFNLSLKSYGFNFDEQGNEAPKNENKCFAINSESGEFFTKITGPIIGLFNQHKEFERFKSLIFLDITFRSKLLAIDVDDYEKIITEASVPSVSLKDQGTEINFLGLSLVSLDKGCIIS